MSLPIDDHRNLTLIDSSTNMTIKVTHDVDGWPYVYISFDGQDFDFVQGRPTVQVTLNGVVLHEVFNDPFQDADLRWEKKHEDKH